MDCDLDSSIPDWIIEHPETIPIFNELGIDTSCGGKSLGYMCVHEDLDPNDVFARLRDVIDGRAIVDHDPTQS